MPGEGTMHGTDGTHGRDSVSHARGQDSLRGEDLMLPPEMEEEFLLDRADTIFATPVRKHILESGFLVCVCASTMVSPAILARFIASDYAIPMHYLGTLFAP